MRSRGSQIVFILGSLKNLAKFTGKIHTLTHTKSLITCNSHSDKLYLKSGSHVSENVYQIKMFTSLLRKNTIICLLGV